MPRTPDHPISCPSEVVELVERFRRNQTEYATANETQVRREFIDPFFEALGWDVANRRGDPEAYKQVIHEDALRISGTRKAPDYAFRTGGVRKFFVEAKRPGVSVKGDSAAAGQVRRYAWSANLPISVVTNFRELAVYDCRGQPRANDSAKTGRILYVDHGDYFTEWSRLAGLLGFGAVSGGSIDRIADQPSRGAVPVDDAFLDDMEKWRAGLARNLAHRNVLSEEDLNLQVQRLLDRLLFLRICEDRGTEPYEQLHRAAQRGEVYAAVLQIFRRAGDRYNSGLFFFHSEPGHASDPDETALALRVDDAPLAEVINNLYPPESSYEFSAMPLEILGQVYERFLGNVVRLRSPHRVEIEQKPEVRRAGGVYYTPRFVVDHIVQATLAKLLARQTVESTRCIRILDPACGSGSFLIRAYDYLLDWYLDRYLRMKRRPSGALREIGPGRFALTTEERKRILTCHIFGIDIDQQAVEVTKLSLLLRVLEADSYAGPAAQIALFHQRVLPDLGKNIRVGNSLIGTDFIGGSEVPSDEEIKRVKPFDWRSDFPDAEKAGGFDVVIGNPPYLNLKRGFLSDREKVYFERQYTCAQGQYDAFALFTERALSLLRAGGRHAFVLPKPVLVSESYEPLRRRILEEHLASVVDCGRPFRDADVEAVVVVVHHGGRKSATKLLRIDASAAHHLGEVRQDAFLRLPFVPFSYLLTASARTVISRMQKHRDRLGAWADLFSRGIEAGKRDPAVVRKGGGSTKPLLRGEDVDRYRVNYTGILYDLSRATRKAWKDERLYETRPKIVIRRVANEIKAAVDSDGLWTLNTLYTFVPKPDLSAEFVVGVLNSRALSYFLRTAFLSDDKLFPYLRISQLEALPVFRARKSGRERVAALVKDITRLSQGPEATRPSARQKRLASLRDDLDRVVCEAYGLSAGQTEIVLGRPQRSP